MTALVVDEPPLIAAMYRPSGEIASCGRWIVRRTAPPGNSYTARATTAGTVGVGRMSHHVRPAAAAAAAIVARPAIATDARRAGGGTAAVGASGADNSYDASAMSRKRRRGSRSRQRAITRRSECGVSGGIDDRSMCRLRTSAIVSLTVSAAKSVRPLSIS
jgi:hypothetical protein